MNVNPICYVVVSNDGARYQPCYETEAAALAAIYEAKIEANGKVAAAKFRDSIGRKHWTDDYDLKARERFDAAGWHPQAVEMTDTIYRLNTIPQESVQLVNEIVMRLRFFKVVYLKWTCTGFTRSVNQGAASACFLEKHGFVAATNENGDVEISWKEVR